MRTILIPGAEGLRVEHMVFDLNGTLAERGALVAGVGERLDRLARDVELHLLTADTFGTAGQIALGLPVSVEIVRDGPAKAALVRRLGSEQTIAVGNGRNDGPMLEAAGLGIAVIGAEGAASAAVLAADVICRSTLEMLDLLLDDRLLAATLRT